MKPPYWSARRPILIGTAAMVLLLGGFGLWASLTTLSGAIVAPGTVEVEQNRQIVQHPDGGVVAEILVKEGASVAAGDVLLRLDGAALASELAIVQGRLGETQTRRVRLEAERDAKNDLTWPEALAVNPSPELAEQMDGQKRLFHARAEAAAQEHAQLNRQIEQIHDRIDGIDAQALALEKQQALIAQELTSQEALLKKGLAQIAAVLALQREAARLLGQAGELAANRAQAEERITEIELQIGHLALRMREDATAELRDIGPVELELIARRRLLEEQISRLDIRAPVAGLVLGLAVTTPRAVIRAADAILYIVPQDRPLKIAAQVAPIQIDQVYPGQGVELVFSGLSRHATPHLLGEITVVSADALTDSATHASYYRVEITLNQGEIARLNGQVLLPGMPVEAFIETEAKTPLAWLVQPFTDYFRQALRES